MAEPVTIAAFVLTVASAVLGNIISHFIIKLTDTPNKTADADHRPVTKPNEVSMAEIDLMIDREVENLIKNGKVNSQFKRDFVRQIATEVELLARRTKYLDVTEHEIKLVVERNFLFFRKKTDGEMLLSEMRRIVDQRYREINRPQDKIVEEYNQDGTRDNPKWVRKQTPSEKSDGQKLLDAMKQELSDGKNIPPRGDLD